ncbi:HNH endonuclease [Lysobacter enzymogenes]|nr:HNH endonuclease signature motif containing protein [Lysobacter enzymogenes]QCW26313.1 HNH endonuclease [Lysobacter enzymogenes]
MTSRTENALLARGLDSSAIQKILDQRLTLGKLKTFSHEKLRELGLRDEQIDSITSEARPPIPGKTVVKLLHDSRRACCVCRDASKSIIIHHIKEWSKSHDHSEKNLVVLCLEHHNAAHTKQGLSLSLTAGQIRVHKQKWLKQVSSLDAHAILGLAQIEGARWDYVNHTRLFELALENSTRLKDLQFFDELLDLGMLTKSGLISSPQTWSVGKPRFRLYDVYEGLYLYQYIKRILENVLPSLKLVDLTNRWSRADILSLIKPGTWVSLQSAFYFKSLTDVHEGRNQTRRGRRRRAKIELYFEFDAWESTSSSSQNLHLRGYQTALAVVHVRSIQTTESGVKISGSCLAIGSHLIDGRSSVERPPPSQISRWELDDESE